MKPLTLKKRRIVFFVCLLLFVVLGSGFFLYSQGYTLDKNLTFSRRGGLYVSAPFSNAEFFVNGKKEKTTGILNNAIFIPNLKVGEYSILIAKAGYWPWAKTLEVKEGLTTEARAFGVPEDPEGEVLLKGKFLNIWGSPLQDILMLQEQKNGVDQLTFYMPGKKIFLTTDSVFSENVLSVKESISSVFWGNNSITFKKDGRFVKVDFRLSDNSLSANYIDPPAEEASDFEKFTTGKEQKIWWNDQTNEIFTEWLKVGSLPPYYICEIKTECEFPVKIFQSRFKIKNVDFFPKRRDVIIISVGTGIYALEIDGRSGRLAYPLYKGGDPNFVTVEDKIFILDSGSLIEIYIK